jgi:hypothetical protein
MKRISIILKVDGINNGDALFYYSIVHLLSALTRRNLYTVSNENQVYFHFSILNFCSHDNIKIKQKAV